MTAMIVMLVSLVFTIPAFADHRTFDGGSEAVVSSGSPTARGLSESHDLDIEVKVGRDHFRLGGRFLGPDGVAGAWVNGRVRPWGLSLDGRVQYDGWRAFNFKLDAELLDWLPRAPRAWRPGVAPSE